MADSKLLDEATLLVTDIINRAQENLSKDEQQNEDSESKIDIYDDPVAMAMVREFVSEVLCEAQKQTSTRVSSHNTQNMEIDDGNIEANISMQAQNWVSQFKRRAWYSRASRFFITVFGRMCPCKTPGEQ